jgi:dolichyldiphosphatase
MPSTHSAAITFYAVYIILSANRLPIHPAWHFPTSPYVRVVPSIISLPWAAGVSLSRVGLHHHTMKQVGAGCLLGAVTAGVWFQLWTAGLNHLGAIAETALNTRLGL